MPEKIVKCSCCNGTGKVARPRFKKGMRVAHVSDASLTGVVKDAYSIKYCGKLEPVVNVKWDGKPAAIPMQMRDEARDGRRSGYSPFSLVALAAKR